MKRVNFAILLTGALWLAVTTNVMRAQKPAPAAAHPALNQTKTTKPAPAAPKPAAAASVAP